MYRRQYGHDRYDKMYDMIELIYILNRLSNNSNVDEHSKKYLIGMLEDAESIINNFDNFREDDLRVGCCKSACNKFEGCNSNNSNSFIDKIIFFLNSLNN